MELNHFGHAIGQNAFHFVWKPKYCWDPFKFDKVKASCGEFLNEVAFKHGFKIYELSVQPDRIHLFVEVPHVMSVAKALQLFKGYSAYKLFRAYRV